MLTKSVPSHYREAVSVAYFIQVGRVFGLHLSPQSLFGKTTHPHVANGNIIFDIFIYSIDVPTLKCFNQIWLENFEI